MTLLDKFAEDSTHRVQPSLRSFSGDYNLHVDGTYLPSPIGPGDQYTSFAMRRSKLEPLLHRLLMNDTPDAQGRLRIIDGMVTGMKPSSTGDRIASVDGRLLDGDRFELENIDLIIGECLTMAHDV